MTMSKCDRIRSWLKAGRAITPVEALNRFGVMRLAARVHELRQRGMPIVTERVMRMAEQLEALPSLLAAAGVAGGAKGNRR